MGARAEVVRRFFAEVRSASHERFAGLIDFSYQHYALGDALTTQVNLACLAKEAGCSAIDLHLIVDPVFPAAPTQGFINSENYRVHVDNLLPAFLCLPGLGSLRLVRDSMAAGLTLLRLVASRAPMWPSLREHLRHAMSYPMGHEIINAFYRREGYLPRLGPPRGYGRWARSFLAKHWGGRFAVCINPRQSRLAAVPATTYRDSPLEEWHAFIDAAGARYPDVHFFMLGGFPEWDSTLARRANVSIPRVMGLTLAHELALIASSDLFMGTSSGFATMATFCGAPYVITNIEQAFAPYAGIPANAPRYPFATELQHLDWRREDARMLMEHLESMYRRLGEKA